MNDSREFIWIIRWEDFQTFQKKRGKPWAPPWIKNYTKQLHDERYLGLTDRQRALLHDLRMLFAMTEGRLSRDSSTISRYRHRQTRDGDLVALSDAGFIVFCSGTVLERFRDVFWNGSTLEVEVEEKKDLRAVGTTPKTREAGNGTAPGFHTLNPDDILATIPRA